MFGTVVRRASVVLALAGGRLEELLTTELGVLHERLRSEGVEPVERPGMP